LSCPIFHEVQKFRQTWLWIITLPVAAALTSAIVTQVIFGEPWGNRPLSNGGLLVTSLLAILFCGGLILLFRSLRLVTEVRREGLFIRYYPFHRSFRRVPLERVVRHAVVTYKPLRNYGGYGIRYGLSGKAYNVSGNLGVRLEFSEGRHLLIGSQRPEELDAAIAALNRGLPARSPDFSRSVNTHGP
jgi:hypothetical protein